MNAEIITIGDEILIGHTVDTNSAWIARRLNMIGISVAEIISVSDKKEHIIEALDKSIKRADFTIITGGLGPTRDDLTKNTLTGYFNDTLVFNEQVFSHIESYFKARDREVGQHNRNQAMLPSKCQVLFNRLGTAPGMWFEEEGNIVVSLPGVPHEMKAIMENIVLDKFSALSNGHAIIHKYILTQGIPESSLMEKILPWEDALPADIKLAYLPAAGTVRLRLSAKTTGEGKVMEARIETEIQKVKPLIEKYITGYDDDSLERTIGVMLKDKGITLATAESCTGGYIAHLITSVSGSSEYFRGSVVAYHNDIKENVLKVDRELIKKHGAVSQEVIEAMIRGILELTGADWAVATSGVAGPLGGTAEKPVGTVWIAVGTREQVVSRKYLFGNERSSNIERSAVTALNMLRKELINTFAN